jgi:hypothetical protein
MENILKKELHQQGDLTFHDDRRCYAILANCSKADAGGLCGRLKKSLLEYLTRTRSAGAVTIEMGYATYPDDARNSVGLLKIAKGE